MSGSDPPAVAALASQLSQRLRAGELADRMQAALQACPGVRVEDAAFALYLAERLPEADPLQAVASVHLTDLYLSCACGAGQPAALAILEDQHLAQVGSWLRRFRRGQDFTDEVRQQLREFLLVPRAGQAAGRIADYSGRGPLERYLRTAAARLAVDLLRRERPAESEQMLEALLPGPDPELDFIKLRDRDAVRTALSEAIAALPEKDLGFLRLHYLEAVPLPRMVALYRVHRATMARWLASARDQVLDRVRSLLAARLALSASECDSLIDLVRSRLELSLGKALARGE